MSERRRLAAQTAENRAIAKRVLATAPAWIEAHKDEPAAKLAKGMLAMIFGYSHPEAFKRTIEEWLEPAPEVDQPTLVSALMACGYPVEKALELARPPKVQAKLSNRQINSAGRHKGTSMRGEFGNRAPALGVYAFPYRTARPGRAEMGAWA